MREALYCIENVTYSDTCGDDYYGKERRSCVLYYVIDTKENVDELVKRLNDKNNSYWSREPSEEELEFGSQDYLDEDYIRATEVEVTSINEIIDKEFKGQGHL